MCNFRHLLRSWNIPLWIMGDYCILSNPHGDRWNKSSYLHLIDEETKS